MEAVDGKIAGLNTVVGEIHDMMHAMTEQRSNQLLNWSLGVGSTLLGIIGYLLATYVFQ
jgi:hypothetical protein